MAMDTMLNGMFGKLKPGMCRLSINGDIAVKTNSGYKTYNVKTGRLTNCDNFVFDVGQEFFFLIPTNKVALGDIILVDGKPNCVLSSDKNSIRVINYENSTINTVLKERHMFMGNAYFCGKIVSLFNAGKGKGGMKNILSYMAMSEMMKGSAGTGGNMGNLLPLMMMSGAGNGMFNMFENMFDEDEDEDEDVEYEDEEIEYEYVDEDEEVEEE